MLELSAKHSASIHLAEIGVAIVGIELKTKGRSFSPFTMLSASLVQLADRYNKK